MMNSNYPLVLDVHTAVSQASIPVPRGDTARSISVTLCEDGRPFVLPDGAFAVFTGEKADGTTLVNYCVIERGTIKYYFTAQTAAAVGRVAAQIKVYDADEKLITSPRITLVVHETAVTDAMISENEATVLEGIIVTEAKRREAEIAREEAEVARVDAEAKREEDFANAKFGFEEERAEIVEEMQTAKADIIASAETAVSDKTQDAVNTIDSQTIAAVNTIDSQTIAAVKQAKGEVSDFKDAEVVEAEGEINVAKAVALSDIDKSKQEILTELEAAGAFVDEKEELLWTNPSPTSRFSTADIQIDNYTDYESFRIEFYRTCNPDDNRYGVLRKMGESLLLRLGETGHVTASYSTYLDGEAATSIVGRTVSVTEDGIITIYGIDSVNNNYCIPSKIYGIKNTSLDLSDVFTAKEMATEALSTAEYAKAVAEDSRNVAIRAESTANEAKDLAEKAGLVTGGYVANSLKGRVVGEGSVYIDDISPIEHTLDVKARSKNILDVANATVWTQSAGTWNDRMTAERYGNGIKMTAKQAEAQSWTTGGFTLGLTKDFLGKTLTLSFGNVTFSMQSGSHRTCIFFGICKHDDYYMNSQSNMLNVSTVSDVNVLTFTIPADADYETYPYLRIGFYINSGGAVSVGDYAIYEDIMVEEGAVSEPMYTEYVNVGDINVDILGKNILDVANATVWTQSAGTWDDRMTAERYGNGIKMTAKQAEAQSWTTGGFTLGLTKDFLGKTLTLSFSNVAFSMQSGNHKTTIFFGICKHDDYYLNGQENMVGVSTYASATNTLTATIPADTDYETYPYLRIGFYINSGGALSVGDYAIYEDIMVEVNDTATEYEPYIEPTTYTPNADGIVDGVKSVYPATTFISDTTGVIIEAQYNKDANKVVASLEERIAALEAAIVSK